MNSIRSSSFVKPSKIFIVTSCAFLSTIIPNWRTDGKVGILLVRNKNIQKFHCIATMGTGQWIDTKGQKNTFTPMRVAFVEFTMRRREHKKKFIRMFVFFGVKAIITDGFKLVIVYMNN
jgi:hypothetical protein